MAAHSLALTVVEQAQQGGIRVSSNFARSNADWVAIAASMGFITTKTSSGVYSRTWRPTAAGLAALERTYL